MKYIYALIIVCFLLTFIWFRQGNILGGGDAGLAFYSPSIAYNLSKTIWVEYGTGGSTMGWLPTAGLLYFYSLWEKIGVPVVILQASYFFIIMVTGVLSVYFLSLLALIKKNQLIPFIAALFYLFNPFTMSQVWARGQLVQQTAFALLPFALLLFVLGIKRKNFLFAVLIALVSAFLSTAFGFLTFVIVFWLVPLIYLLFNRSIFGVMFFMLTFLLWVIVNSWWFIPLFISSGSIYSANISGLNENLGTLLGVSRNFTPGVLIRLLQRTYFFDPSAFSTVYSSFPFQLISLLAPIFLLIGLIKVIKSNNLGFKFFIVLLVLGLIVSLGANPPLGWLFVWIFKIFTPLQAFRNPFEKFGLVLILGYSPIFAYGLVSFFAGKRYKNLAIATALFLICGIFAWPMWTGRVIAGPDQKAGLSAPFYYKDLNKWLSENNGDERVLMTPLWSGDGAFYQWGASRYQGSDPMIYLLDQPTISNSMQGPFYFEYISSIRKYMERMNLAAALALLRTKYLINRKDAVMLMDQEKEHSKFLTEIVYPFRESSDKQKVCQKQFANSNVSGIDWIVCPIADTENNWSQIRYLQIKVKTDVPSLLDIAIMDRNGVRVRWDGRFDKEYSTGEGLTLVTIPLGNPTEHNFAIDYSKVYTLEIQARSKDKPELSVNEINLEEISLDPGKEERIDNFRLIKTFGNLEVYEPVAFKSPPLFGSLTRVSFVPNFLQLFEQVNKQNDSVESLGFLVTSQNLGRDLQKLEGAGTLRIEDKYEASNTRFWLKTNQSPGFILLSKTFNTQWKLIPGVSRNQLSGNLFEDWDLLNKTSMEEENHFVVNGYANLWKVDGREEYAIIYKPQIIADIGTSITKYSLLLLSGILVFSFIKKYVKKNH